MELISGLGLRDLKFFFQPCLIANIVDFQHSENEQHNDPFLLQELVEMFALLPVEVLPLPFNPVIIL